MTVDLSGPETTELVASLRAAGCVFAEDEAALLVAAAGSRRELADLTARRVSGEPLEVVVGWAELAGVRVSVAPGVFVPRRRTELLARQAADLSAGAAPANRAPVVVDLCCGSGAVGAVVAAALPGVQLHAADLDPAAVRCARHNLAGLGEVHEGDLFSALPPALRGRVDVLVANVPYVPTDEIALLPAEARLHEPVLALDGGPDGLDLLRRVAEQAPGWLVPGGHLLVETSERQTTSAVAVVEAAGLLARAVRDEDLEVTVVIGRRPLS